MKLTKLIYALLISVGLQAQEEIEPLQWYWASLSYGTPVITNSPFNENGVLEIKVGARLTESNISLVGGLNNSLVNSNSSVPERFSLFFGPGYFFKDRLIFFSIHTGLSYPFYKNAPEGYPQSLGMHNALDLGVRLVPKMAVGIGFNQHISNDVPAYALHFFLQLNSK